MARLLLLVALNWLGLTAALGAASLDRSPVDLELSADGRWLISVNQAAGTLSLVNLATLRVVDELAVGEKCTHIARLGATNKFLVTSQLDGQLTRVELVAGKLKRVGATLVGGEPLGIAVTRDQKRAYVAQSATDTVAIVDLTNHKVVGQIAVGRWPRQLALSRDGRRLAVATSGDLSISIVDAAQGKMLFQEDTGGINLGQVYVSNDGEYAYAPWMVYRHNPITVQNIKLGWVLGTRIGRVKTSSSARREAITLDPPGMAVADPHGLAFTSDEKWMVCAASGTHELLVYHVSDQKFVSIGPGDHVDGSIVNNPKKFFRVPLGGRPMNVRMAADDRHVLVANHLLNAIQIVDLQERAVVKTIELGSDPETSLARQGATIFYDGRRSLDQWYSCHSCHYEGGHNAVVMDTKNDRSDKTFKTVPSLANVTKTGPWTWHGWQSDLNKAMLTSLTETMLGPKPTEDDARALLAYLETLQTPASPYLAAEKSLGAAAQRGQQIFQGAKAGCSKCHSGAYFTDGQIHDVSTGGPRDLLKGYNTPSLLGVFRRSKLLHDGRAKSLEEVLTGDHNPSNVTGNGELTPDERRDLIEYLKTL